MAKGKMTLSRNTLKNKNHRNSEYTIENPGANPINRTTATNNEFPTDAPVNAEVQRIQESGVRDSIPLEELIPASDEWNFYEEYTPDKMEELIESILSVGLLQPIVVWKRSDNKYMILAGHNRYKAYQILNESGKYGARYSRILANIKGINELDDNMAQQIIIDTNWVSRELTPTQRAKSIVRKYAILEQSTVGRANLNQILGDTYGLGRTQITAYKSLVDLIPELQRKIDSCDLGIRAGGKISKLAPEVQKYIYDEYLTNDDYSDLVNKLSSKFKPEFGINDIKTLFDFQLGKVKESQQMGAFEITYPSHSHPGVTNKATVTYPKEDEQHFFYLLKLFCGEEETSSCDGTPKMVAIDSDVYENGDFVFRKIK